MPKIAIRAERMNADISYALGTSALLDISRTSKVGIELRVDGGTHNGTIYFRVVNAKTNTPITLSIPAGITVANGVAIDQYIEIIDLAAKWLEIFYDRTDGDGYMSAHVHLKNEAHYVGR